MEVLAACHVHSTWSYDGSWPLVALSAKFARRGYRVLMMTEHDRGFTAARYEQYREACAEVSSNAIHILPGIEYSDADNRVHVLVWGTGPFLGESLPTKQLLEAVGATDGVAVLAHPSRRAAWKHFEPHWADKLLGIEAWNRKYDGWAPSKAAPALLRADTPIPFVGLDFHTQRQFFPLAMALDMDSDVTTETILQCLRSRRCSGRAFGLPLTDNALRKSLFALKMADRARRTAASMYRSVKSLSPLPKA